MCIYFDDYDKEQLINTINSKMLVIKNLDELVRNSQNRLDHTIGLLKKNKRECKFLNMNREYWRDRFEDLRRESEAGGLDVEKIDFEFAGNYNELTPHDLSPDEIINMWADGTEE